MVEADVRANYAPEVVLLTSYGVFCGHAGVNFLSELMKRQLPDAQLTYTNRLVKGEFAFVEWKATSPRGCVEDGTDSFVIKDGRICLHTIHYTFKPKLYRPEEVFSAVAFGLSKQGE